MSPRKQFEQRDNSGALFKNDRKKKANQPDYKGDVTIAGEPYWISAWLKESESGLRYMSLAFKPKKELEDSAYPVVKTPRGRVEREPGDDDDGRPF